MFTIQADNHPQKVSVELDEQCLTYGELMSYVERIALLLLDHFHIQPGEIICQCVERSIEMVIGMMAIEVVGGVYCPLSAADPQNRLQQLIRDTNSHLVLVDSMTRHELKDVEILCMDDWIVTSGSQNTCDVDHLSSIKITPDNLAYVLFTSGSTGTPKAHNEQLVAYVQAGSDMDSNRLRIHCESDLPLHMIPGMFIIMEQFPLNANGKVDRKALPQPQRRRTFVIEHEPQNEIEARVEAIWCSVLSCDRVSTTTSFFSLGGHSLLLMELYHRYESEFNFDRRALSINMIFSNPTILQHARLLEKHSVIEERIVWHPLNMKKAIASFAQERIFMDEMIRLSSNDRIYSIPFVYQVSHSGLVSIARFRRALDALVIKHDILRTSLLFNSTSGQLEEHVEFFSNNIYTFVVTNANDQDNAQQMTLFDIEHGRVLHCQIIRNASQPSPDDLLESKDFIVINIHHIAFDGASMSLFLHDLQLAYETDLPLPAMLNGLKYIDYAVHERQIDMTISRQFWRSLLDT
ncbi:unnamed protein product, partial [Rotaria sordida]